ALLGPVPGLDAAHRAQHIHDLEGESLMLAYDEKSATPVDVTEQGTRAEVAIGNPEIPRLDRFAQRSKQRALLGMAIFTGKDIAHHAVCGLIDDQGLPRQGAALDVAQGFAAPLARLQTMAINNFHAVPGQPGRTRPIKLLDQRRQLRRTIAYQLRR